MAIAFLAPKTKIQFHGEPHVMIRKYDDGVWQIEHCSTGRLSELPEASLLDSLREGALHIIVEEKNTSSRTKMDAATSDRHWNSLSEDERKLARRRAEYVKKAILQPLVKSRVKETIKQVGAAIQDASPPCANSVIDWCRRYIAGGRDISALARYTNRSGNRKARMRVEVQDIVDASLDETYLKRERVTLEDTLLHAATKIDAYNRLLSSEQEKLTVPSIRYVRRRLAKHTPFDICAARYGLQFALRRFRNVLGFSRGERPLERVEIDHTPINLVVIDDRSALPLGRPWLTIALDDATRSVHGYYLSFEPPSYLSVAHCLVHAILPKTYIKERYPKLTNPWKAYGVMENLVVDNGPEFHSAALEDAALQYGITIQYCPKAAPWYKGKIERFLGTINREVSHGIPGTTFANILERDDYDPVTTATITLTRLHEIIHKWIVDFYHQKVHRTLHNTPALEWDERIVGMPIALPTQLPDLEAAFAVPEQRVLTFKGIELFTMFYNSEECAQLRRRLGDKTDIVARYLPADLGYIYIQDPTSQRMLKVPVVERFKAYATGLSKWQHGVCQKYAAKRLQGRVDIIALAQAKREIAEMVEEEIFLKRRKLRKKAARFDQAGRAVEPVPPGDATSSAPAATANNLPAAPDTEGSESESSTIYFPACVSEVRYVQRPV